MTQTENRSHTGAASPYMRRGDDNAGALRLAHTMDVEHVCAHVQGQRILDVNVGAGRLALPLLQQGKTVTGIDASSAVLDECRHNAGSAPITLLVGDMFRVSLPDETFDTVIAHRTLMAGVNWQVALTHWGHKLVDGGRLLIDVDSLDHRQHFAQSGEAPSDGDNRLALSVEQIAAFASSAGFIVKAVVPTRSFLCGDNFNFLLAPHLDGVRRWQRFLSWLSVDDSLFALACLVEREIAARLTSRCSASMLVVLEKRSDPASNQVWLERDAARNQLLFEQRVDIGGLVAACGEHFASLGQRLEPLLLPLRNRSFAYRLVRPLLLNVRFDLAGLIPQPALAEMRSWAEHDALDVRVNHLSETWAECVDANLRDLAPALHYPLVRTLIAGQTKSTAGGKA